MPWMCLIYSLRLILELTNFVLVTYLKLVRYSFALAWIGVLLRGGDHPYKSVRRIANTVAMPSWITGEAAGWCVYFLFYVLSLGVKPK